MTLVVTLSTNSYIVLLKQFGLNFDYIPATTKNVHSILNFWFRLKIDVVKRNNAFSVCLCRRRDQRKD